MDLVSFNAIFPEIYIGIHKMVSYRSQKCKYTQDPGQGRNLTQSKPRSVCAREGHGQACSGSSVEIS